MRIRGRGNEERHGAREQGVGERGEIGQESGGRCRRQIHGFAFGGRRCRRVRRIERIGHQDCGASGARGDVAFRGDGAEEKSLAAAVENEQFGVRIDRARELEAPPEPGRGRLAERLDALCQRILAEIGDVLLQDRSDKVGDAVLRLAHGKADGCL